MQFLLLSTSAVIGLMAALATVPLVIHLINMMRHRRVKWAAMEFLLQSYKKQRNWIFFKQLLLLLLRMAVMVAIVAMLARFDTADQLAALFGGQTTHHYVLLDDSYSMSDEGGGQAAFERGKDVVATIARRAGQEQTRQRMTLIRLSRSTLGEPAAADGQTLVDNRVDLSAEIIDAEFEELLEQRRRTFEVSELSVGPAAALTMVQRLVAESASEQAHVYLISDFRQNDWRNPAEVRKSLQELEKVGAELHLVRCVSEQQPNMAITYLAPAEQTRAAGVPLYVEVKVKNHGPDIARKVPVKIESVYYDPAREIPANAGKLKGDGEDLPTVLIDRIDPGETVARRVQVYFPSAGKHVVQATIPDDAVQADNRRICAVDFPEGVPVLVIDDNESERNDAYYLTSVFDPGQRARTGVRPQVKTSAFLRDTNLDTLNGFQAVYLLDVPRLDQSAVDNLRRYVEGGGGLAFFLGPNTNVKFYNQLRDAADGLFPVPLDRDDLLPPAPDAEIPDFSADEHPVFQYLSGESNVYLRGVAVERYYRAAPGFAPDPQSSTKVIARLRDRSPLVVAKQLGQGRVVAFLTTAAPTWNNWARDDSFGLMILNLQAYLADPTRSDQQLLVGGPIEVQLDATTFRPDLSFYVPSAAASGRQRIVRNAQPPKEDSPVLDAWIGRAADESSRNGETDRSGVYEAWPMTKKNEAKVLRYALNVDPEEGNLAAMQPRTLAAALMPVTVELHQAAEYQFESTRRASSNWTNVILIVLIGILLLEQGMAYSASYHPARGGTT